ncbi:MAG: type II secretion system GspH family protein, partial [Chitinispirillales bacterium]|nr:type II secretion system GspH family protein [Chitinispirillales bacterium]
MEKNVKTGGFSIVEVLISLVLVSFALIAIVAVFPKMTAHRKVIREVDQAHILAMEALEKVQLESEENPWPLIDLTEFADTLIVGNTEFKIQFNGVNNVPGVGFIKTTDVTVSWDKGGKTHRISLTGAA